MDLKLKGKRVLVTGGSKGIGKACAAAFVEEGATVMIAARYRELYKEMSFGRRAAPEEIAHARVFLASERSAYTTGCVLTIDGGLAARWS